MQLSKHSSCSVNGNTVGRNKRPISRGAAMVLLLVSVAFTLNGNELEKLACQSPLTYFSIAPRTLSLL